MGLFSSFRGKVRVFDYTLSVYALYIIDFSVFLQLPGLSMSPYHQFWKLNQIKQQTLAIESVLALVECSLLCVALNRMKKTETRCLIKKRITATFVCIYLFRLSAGDIFLCDKGSLFSIPARTFRKSSSAHIFDVIDNVCYSSLASNKHEIN